MRPVHLWTLRLIRCQFALWLLAVFVGAPQLLAAESAESSREKIEKAFNTLQQVDAKLPADTFDPVAVVKSVGPDADKLFAWEQQHTRWAPYRGALRGPVGVLMDRTGNSLDRSLLLAELLKTMGVTTRLAHATLTADQAKTLLEQLKKAQQNPLPPFDEPPPGASKSTASVQLDKIGEDLAQNFADVSAPLNAAMKKPASADRSADILAALSDHWWLQKQDGGNWVDLDVTIPDSQPGQSITAAVDTFPCNLPGGPVIDKDLWHTVRIAIVAEQWADGKLTSSTVLNRVVRTSGTVGETIYLTHIPLDWKAHPSTVDTAEARDQALKQALAPTEWVPMLRLTIDAVTDAGVRPDGSVDPKPQMDAMARTGGAVVKSAGGAAQALDDAFNDKPAVAVTQPTNLFTAEWVDYTIHTPGEADKTIRRQVFDLIGPAARATGVTQRPEITDAARADAAMALFGRVDILALPCQFSSTFVGHHLMQSLLAAKPALLSSLDAMQKPGGGDAEGDAAPPCPGALYGMALARHRFSPSAADWFIGRTNLFTYHSYARFTADGHQLQCEATDLVANDVTPLPWSNNDAFTTQVNQGIVDTIAEQSFLPPNTRITSAARSLTAASTQGVPLTTLHAVGDLQHVQLTPDVMARIGEELRAGRTVVVPSKAVHLDDEDRVAWWSIDPATGRTMGMSEQGWGASMAEYAAKLQQWIETHKRFVCLGAAAATVLNIVSPLLGVNELEGDAISTVQAALDAACAG